MPTRCTAINRILQQCALLLLLLAPGFSLAQDQTKEEVVVSYFLFSGQSKIITISGDATVLDEEIVSLKKIPGTINKYRITGSHNGTTQIVFFSPEGVMQHIRVSVGVPSFFSKSLLSPQFEGNKPIFSFLVSNLSSFNKTNFYVSPSNAYSSTAYFPRFLGGSLFANSQANNQDLQNIVINYKNSGYEQIFGNISTSSSSIPTIISGSELIGSKANINFGNVADHRMEVFLGEASKENYSEVEKKLDHFGGNYSFSKSQSLSYQPNYIKLNAFGYKISEAAAYNPGMGFDSAYNLSQKVFVEGSFLKAENGFAGLIAQNFNSEMNSSKLDYTFIKGGLQGMNSAVEEFDQHNMNFGLQHLFKDQKTFFALDTTFDKSIAALDTEDLADSMSASLGTTLARQYSDRNIYSAKYNFSTINAEDHTTLANGLLLSWVHTLDLMSYLTHSAGTSYTNSLDTNQKKLQASTSHSYTMEKERFAIRSSLNFGANLLDTPSQSLQFSQFFDVNLNKRLLLDFMLSYSRPSLSSNSNLLTSNNLLTASLSHNDFLSVVIGTNQAFGLTESFTGYTGLQFQKFFGPGVSNDSLIKRVFKGNPKSNVFGQLYLDQNYNSYFDSADKPLANVTVILNQELRTTTNGQGIFRFANVKAGQHDLETLVNPLGFESQIELVPSRNLVTAEGQDLHLNVPVHFKKAGLQILFVDDVNGDKVFDPMLDHLVNIQHAYVSATTSQFNKTLINTVNGTKASGLDAGKYRVFYDPAEIPDEYEATSPLEMQIEVADKKNQTVIFWFRAIRILQGGLFFNEQSQALAGKLTLMMGDQKLKLVNDHFVVSDPKTGSYQFTIPNLPAGYCVEPTLPYAMMILDGSFSRSVQFAIKACPK